MPHLQLAAPIRAFPDAQVNLNFHIVLGYVWSPLGKSIFSLASGTSFQPSSPVAFFVIQAVLAQTMLAGTVYHS